MTLRMLGRAWAQGFAGILVGALLAPSAAAADEPPKASPVAAELLESMREKGILSQEEYEDLYRRQALHELKEREDAQLPGWIRNWTFGGDVRLRWERIAIRSLPAGLDSPLSEHDPVDSKPEGTDLRPSRAFGNRDRGRLLMRLGAERRLGDNFLVGFRIATSQSTSYGDTLVYGDARKNLGQTFSADPRSMNTTFGDFFSPKSLFFDRAYVQFAPKAVPSLRVTAGKIPNPFTSTEFPADFVVWDPDLQPEGGSVEYGFDLMPERLRLDLKGSYSFLDEIGSVSVSDESKIELPDLDDRDPYMYVAQSGLTFQATSWLRLGGRVTYMDLQNLGAGFAAAVQDLGNTATAIENNPSLALLADVPLEGLDNPTAKSTGRMREMVYDAFLRFNFGNWAVVPFVQQTKLLHVAGGENRGSSLGLQIDSPFGTRLTVLYGRVARNGTISLFTDSDLFDGYTNAKGYYVALTHPLTPNVLMRAAFFSSRQLRDDCKIGQLRGPSFCDTAGSEPVLSDFRKKSLDRHRMQVDLRVIF